MYITKLVYQALVAYLNKVQNMSGEDIVNAKVMMCIVYIKPLFLIMVKFKFVLLCLWYIGLFRLLLFGWGCEAISVSRNARAIAVYKSPKQGLNLSRS